ncbi:MAG: TetR family transcriptional regulator [Acidobacteriota bacterium]|nr:TetR family transcriptional regulator [Acidobacteriota bacterium]
MSQARTNSADKREAILKAATCVFARNGYFSSKVSDIAKAAGVADGTVYLYFKSKEEILHSIFDRTMAEGIEQAKLELAKCPTPLEKLRCLSKLHLARLGADRDLAIVFQVELRGSTKFMEEFSATGFGDYLNLIRAIFEEGQAAGLFRKDLHSKTCAKILYGALDEMATNWILSEKGYELAGMSDAVLDVFFNGVANKK